MIEKIVSSIGERCYRFRKIIVATALVLFVAVIILQSFAVIEYSYAEESKVTDVFPQDDTVVVVYSNMDESRIADIISFLEKNEHVTSIQAYANTLGAKISVSDITEMMGIDETLVNTLFYIYEHGMITGGMTLTEFVSFISSDDFLNNELFASMMDDDVRSQINQMKTLVDAIASEEEYTVEDISELLGVDKEIVKAVFSIKQLKDTSFSDAPATLFAMIASAMGVDKNIVEVLFDVTPIESLKFTEFVDIVTNIASLLKGIVKSEQLDQLMMLKQMSDAIQQNKILNAKALSDLFSSVAVDSEMLNKDTISLLYVMYYSKSADMSEMSIPLYDFFMFLSEDILNNDAFSSYFDESIMVQFTEAQQMMKDGKEQLIGPDHSRFIITLDYPLESKGMYDFYDSFTRELDSKLSGEYYLVGQSAMSYELSHTFKTENLIITIVTAVVVFLIVWFTFKKFSISALLICVIECAVFSMTSVMTVTGEPMFFIALILVQCILMGSMIDYGILYTTYYIEVRKEFTLDKALPEVMRRATHAILTSSLIIILVTLICSYFMTGAVASILKTLGIGALCAILLILFVLPSLLVIFDKYFITDSPELNGEAE